MDLSERIKVLVQLGQHLRGEDEYLEAVMHQTLYNNAWFTIENQKLAVNAIALEFLEAEKLKTWTSQYKIDDDTNAKKVGLVLAGNIPLVGFHDILCVFVAGHISQIKLSEKDKYLLPYLLKLLHRFDERTADYFDVVERLDDFEAVIATGSNNSSRYFEAYFGKYPHIIRRNRNTVAVLSGDENAKELTALGHDIFRFFGLGCRNVSKIYIPQGFNFEPLLEALHEHRDIVRNTKYKNNFDHNYAIIILDREKYEANGCILMREGDSLQSNIACLNYSYYDSKSSLEQELLHRNQEIQCVVSKPIFEKQIVLPFGKAQEPSLIDYADGVDTMEFLVNL